MGLSVNPPEIPTVFVCNPIPFSCSVEPEDGILAINIEIWDYNHVIKLVSAKYSVYDCACNFDISGYLKNMFPSFAGIDYTQLIAYSDTLQTFQIDVFADGFETQNFTINAVYGVSQVMGTDMINNYASCDKKKFLTCFTTPKFWKRYPFTISVVRDIVPVTDDVWVMCDAGSGEIDTITGVNTLVYLVNLNIGLSYNYNVSNSLWKTYPTITCVLTESPVGKSWESEYKIIQLMNNNTIIGTPVYLRWLNTLGGYDYYMFFLKDVVKNSKTSTINKFPLLLSAANGQHDGTRKVVSKYNNDTWVIGALDIPINEYKELLDIYNSVRVDVWLPKTETFDGAFMGVTLIDKSHTIPQDEVIMDIEMEILMPETFTQR